MKKLITLGLVFFFFFNSSFSQPSRKALQNYLITSQNLLKDASIRNEILEKRNQVLESKLSDNLKEISHLKSEIEDLNRIKGILRKDIENQNEKIYQLKESLEKEKSLVKIHEEKITKLNSDLISSKNSIYSKSIAEPVSPTPEKKIKNSYSYRTYIQGPRGGCYYINSNGNKTYVDRGFCH